MTFDEIEARLGRRAPECRPERLRQLASELAARSSKLKVTPRRVSRDSKVKRLPSRERALAMAVVNRLARPESEKLAKALKIDPAAQADLLEGQATAWAAVGTAQRLLRGVRGAQRLVDKGRQVGRALVRATAMKMCTDGSLSDDEVAGLLDDLGEIRELEAEKAQGRQEGQEAAQDLSKATSDQLARIGASRHLLRVAEALREKRVPNWDELLKAAETLDSILSGADPDADEDGERRDTPRDK